MRDYFLLNRFSLVFEAKGTEVRTALSHLFTLGQRLTFAKSRIDTIQGESQENSFAAHATFIK